MCVSLQQRNPFGATVPFRSPENGLTILGPSGIGKSASVQKVLELFPQVVTHRMFNGQLFPFQQIRWVHLEVPPMGSMRHLCHQFFQCMDKITAHDNGQASQVKNKYYKFYTRCGRASVDTMLGGISSLVENKAISLLSFDEVGRLARFTDSDASRQLSFLFSLLNQAGVAVLLTGTFESLPLITAHPRIMGRASAQGDWIWDRHIETSREQQALLKALEPYQYVHQPVPLDGKIAAALYYETQGFIRYLQQLYMLVQEAAMETKVERITPELIHATAKEKLIYARPMLAAFRFGGRKELVKYPQMFPATLDPYYVNLAKTGDIEGALTKLPELQIAPSVDGCSEGSNQTCSTSDKDLPEKGESKAKPTRAKRTPKILTVGKEARLSKLRQTPGTLLELISHHQDKSNKPTAHQVLVTSSVTRHAFEWLPVEQRVDEWRRSTSQSGKN
jgi:hypothetical protein